MSDNIPLSILNSVEGIKEIASKDVNSWMKAQMLKKVPLDMLVSNLVSSGLANKMQASLMVALANKGLYLNDGVDPRDAERLGPNWVSDTSHAEKHFVDGGDRMVRRIFSMNSLDVVLYENFLSEDEMEHIKRQAEPNLRRSMVIGEGMQSVEDSVRTSDGTFFMVGDDEVITKVENRIEKVTGIPATHGEGLQILRYRGAQQYKPHYDFFEPNNPSEARKIDFAGNRVGTMILYLSDVDEGGSTYFPQLNLGVNPKKGSALWFGYMGKDGVPDRRSEHAGLPVIAGEKWIATKWLRQRPIN